MKRILILLTICLLLSCERENINPEKNYKTLITVEPKFWELSYGACFYFVTDLDGKLLAFKQINSQGLNTLYIQSDKIPEKYNVHRLFISNDMEVRSLESFYNTSKNFFESYYDCEPYPDTTGDCSFHVTGPTYESYLISYPNGSFQSTVFDPNYLIDRTETTNLYYEYNFLYAFLKKDQQYYYKYFYDLIPNEVNTLEIDPQTMSTNFNIKVLIAPESMFLLSQSEIQEVIIGGLCHEYPCNLYSEISVDSSIISIFAPPNSPGKYYKSRIFLKAGDNKEYIFQKKGNLPETIPELDFDLSILSMDLDDIEITCTGTYDFISGYYRVDNNSKNWYFYSDNPDMIKFPDIPSEITEIYPNITGSTFFETASLQSSISLNDYSDIENYGDFLTEFEWNRRIVDNSTGQKLRININF